MSWRTRVGAGRVADAKPLHTPGPRPARARPAPGCGASKAIAQRRCLRASEGLPSGTVLTREKIDVLRPAPLDGIFPYDIDRVVGMKVRQSVPAGEYLRWDMLERANGS